MFGTKFAFAAAFVAAVSAATTVSSPAALLTCQPILLSWTGGAAPYFVAILPGGEASAAPLVNFGQETGNSLTWNVNLAAGTSVTIEVTDSSGVPAYSSPVTVQAGASTTCVGESATVSANGATTEAGSSAATGASSTGAAAGTTTSPSSSAGTSSKATSSSAGTSSKATSSSPASTSAASTSSSSSGAFPTAKVGVAALASSLIGAFFFLA